MKLKQLAIAAMVAAAGHAYAGPALFPGLNLIEDDNREYLIKGTGNTDVNRIEVGDRLRGVVKFDKIEQLDAPFGVLDPIAPQLTAIFETEVTAIGPTLVPGGDIASFISFGASSAFTDVYGAGAAVAIYSGASLTNLNSCASIAQCETDATTGPGSFLWATAGFGDADDQWTSLLSNLNWGLVTTLGASTKVATVNYSLSILTNNTGYLFNEVSLDCAPAGPFLCAGDGKTDLVGSGDVLGGAGLTNGYGARSDIDVVLNRVPEPGSVALAGLALALMGAASRRRKA